MNVSDKSICIIATIDSTLEQFVIPFAIELKKYHVKVVLLASMTEQFVAKYDKIFHLINVPMERGIKPLGMLKTIWTFYKIFKREKFTIIQYATPNASFCSSIAGWFAHIKIRLYCQWGIRYVGFYGVKRWIFKQIETLTCLLSTHIRPVSKRNMQYAINEGHYKREKAFVIGDGGTIGVDPLQFQIEDKNVFKDTVLEQYQQLKDKIVYGFIGRISGDKGVNELLIAFQKLCLQTSDIVLLMIGGVDGMRGLDKNVYLKAQNNEQIIFVGRTSEVPKYLSIIDVLVHPTYREGFSMVIQQAMMMGVPVITTDIPGPSEVIEANKSGLLVQPKDANSLLRALEFMFRNELTRLQMGKNGYERASRLFIRKRMISLTLQDRLLLLDNF